MVCGLLDLQTTENRVFGREKRPNYILLESKINDTEVKSRKRSIMAYMEGDVMQ